MFIALLLPEHAGNCPGFYQNNHLHVVDFTELQFNFMVVMSVQHCTKYKQKRTFTEQLHFKGDTNMVVQHCCILFLWHLLQ